MLVVVTRCSHRTRWGQRTLLRRCCFESTLQVAVKLLSLAEITDKARGQLKREVENLAHVSGSCTHVCRLHGACVVDYCGKVHLAIVMRRYTNSLQKLIQEQPGVCAPHHCITHMHACAPHYYMHACAPDVCNACKCAWPWARTSFS